MVFFFTIAINSCPALYSVTSCCFFFVGFKELLAVALVPQQKIQPSSNRSSIPVRARKVK
jgi:hypothetical protein